MVSLGIGKSDNSYLQISRCVSPPCAVSRYLTDWPGLCAVLITVLSLLLVIVTFPLSLLVTVKVVISHQ